MRRQWVVSLLLVLFTCNCVCAQQSSTPNESHKYRTVFTVAGGGGGFTAGLFAGLSVFDDATNSDRKVWTTAILAGIGGAVGGYFLGRALDKRRTTTTTGVTWKSDNFEGLSRARFPSSWVESKPVQGSDLINHAGNPGPSIDSNDLYLVSAVRKLQGVEAD